MDQHYLDGERGKVLAYAAQLAKIDALLQVEPGNADLLQLRLDITVAQEAARHLQRPPSLGASVDAGARATAHALPSESRSSGTTRAVSAACVTTAGPAGIMHSDMLVMYHPTPRCASAFLGVVRQVKSSRGAVVVALVDPGSSVQSRSQVARHSLGFGAERDIPAELLTPVKPERGDRVVLTGHVGASCPAGAYGKLVGCDNCDAVLKLEEAGTEDAMQIVPLRKLAKCVAPTDSRTVFEHTESQTQAFSHAVAHSGPRGRRS